MSRPWITGKITHDKKRVIWSMSPSEERDLAMVSPEDTAHDDADALREAAGAIDGGEAVSA